MSKRGFWPGLALVALLPGVAGAQVTIDHKPPGCIVAGKHPKLSACFAPVSSLARSRVNFRIDGTPNWYFVDMKSDTPCYQGILPKLQKKMAGRKLQFYVDATDKAFAETRTQEVLADIVKDEGECRKDVPAAPFVNNASVVVGSAAGAPAPFGFVAGGLSTGLVVGVVGAGLVTTGAIVATNGGNDTTPTLPTITTPIVTNPPATTLPPTTVPPTTLPTTSTLFRPAFKVIPDPPQGRSPFRVTYDMCESTGNNLRFTYDFDSDGTEDLRGQCAGSRVYTAFGPTPPSTTTGPTVFTYIARTCVIETNGPRECRNFLVEVTATSLTINSLDAAPASRRLAWASLLEVEGAAGQVVVNGEAASFAARGRSTAVAMGRRGENRVEAQLVQAAGRAGVWRFDLGSTGSLSRGSIRVIAGEVALITPDAVVFRLKGQPGERIVFSFRTGN
jgi:hypothetical protein